MRLRSAFLLLHGSVLLVAGLVGCSSGPGESVTAPEAPPFTPTLRVRTGEVGTIRNDEGVTLTVFPRTVPPRADGSPGEIVFGVRPTTIPAMPPPGFEFPAAEWSFEPAGTDLADFCRISMSVSDSTVTHVLARFDEAAGAWKKAPTVVDPARSGRIAVDVMRLGAWAILRSAVGVPDSLRMGTLRVRNVDSTRAVSLLIREFTPFAPSPHLDFDPRAAGALVAEAGRHGGAGDLASELALLLPPGTYVFEAIRSSRLPSLGGAVPDGWIQLPPIRVERPGGPADPSVTLDPSAWIYVNPSPP